MGVHKPRRRAKREQRATQTIIVSAEPAKVEQVKTEDPLSALFGAALRLCIDHPAAVLIGGDSGPSRTGFRGESEQHSGLKANRIPEGSRTSIPV
jgi:hypothetical protein